jgi:hypothetical protein
MLSSEELPLSLSAENACLETVPPTLEELLSSAAKGDEHAFGLLYDRLVVVVLTTVQSVLHDRAQAEEIAQEVFLQLWREAPRYSPARGSVLTWARVISHRRARLRAADHPAATTASNGQSTSPRPQTGSNRCTCHASINASSPSRERSSP